jgi:trigger factor
MQGSQAEGSALERRLNLAFPVKQIESEVETRLKKLARTVRIHGFRPGKVPMKIVAQQYGGQVRQEVMTDSVQKTFADAVKAQNLRVAGYPRFEPKESAAENFEFIATFEVYPDIEIGSLANASIKRPVTEVTEADVDRTIEILRKQRQHFHKVDRGALDGDQVTLDFEGTLDGAPFPGGHGKGHQFVLGEGRFLPDFETNVQGLRAEDSKSFELTFPADYHAKEMAGKTAKFQVEVHAVAEPHLPELNADFAKTLGVEDGDLGKMRAEVKANLEREAKKRIQAKVKEQVMQALVDHAKLEVPKSLVEIEIGRLAEGAVRDLQARGMTTKDINLPPDIFQAQAEKRVRLGLILAETVKKNGLTAKPDQVRAVIEEHAQSFEQPQEMVRWYYQQPERLAEVESVVLEDNVVAWALNQARVEDLPTAFQDLMGSAK